MSMVNMRQQAQRVSRFVTVQLIALVGWIVVQSCFSLTPLGRSLPFAVMIVVEGIWWGATLVIMFVMHRRVYRRFVQAVLELEDANRRLRERTNTFLAGRGIESGETEEVSPSEEGLSQ
jgi:hypothetical protein